MGVILLIAAAFDSRDDALPVGRGAVVATGLAFTFAGTAIMINGWRTKYRKLLLTINGTLLLGSLAAVPAYFFAAERELPVLCFFLISLVCLTLLGGWATIREIRNLLRTNRDEGWNRQAVCCI